MRVDWHGQSLRRLRAARAAPRAASHLDGVDLLFLPVGGGITIDGTTAAAIAEDLAPSWVVPMHYKTDKINFLETEEAFVDAMPRLERLTSPSFDTGELEKGDGALVVVPRAP